MEWIEVTARTVEEAKDKALDHLGVDESQAEFEVLEEPRPGFLRKLKGQARVRARIKPTLPRPKADRRDRRRRSRAEGTAAEPGAEATSPRAERGGARRGSAPAGDRAPRRPARSAAPTGAAAVEPDDTPAAGVEPTTATSMDRYEEHTDSMSVEEQAAAAGEFLSGLADAFAFDAQVSSERIDDETIEVRLTGDDLGLLIGPRGGTLQAVQDVVRVVLQRSAGTAPRGRVRIDIGGYRQRRREALERFTRGIAEQVLASGVQRALEPMGSADRKVVHDTVNEIDGVATISEGEEPRRRVVIVPE
ncbi:MAG: RNA-binding cell elongation regulator Jag/EloR [Acidimicrobiales bacterium]